MKTKLIMAALTGGFLLAVFYAGHFHGKASCQKQQSNQVIKEVKDEAQSFADRPRTNDDVVKRLCKWAAIRLKDEGQSVKQLPDICD